MARVRRFATAPKPDFSAALLCFAILTPLAAGAGGFFPVAWGWSALGFCWAAAVAVLLRGRVSLTRLEAAGLLAWCSLALWTGASTRWSSDVTQSVLEVERTLVYVSAVGALLFVSRRASAIYILAGTWASITLVCAYSLATRLFPDRLGVLGTGTFEGGRLNHPIGYWNALGLLAAMGLLLAAAIVARQGSVTLRVVAAGSSPLLATTLYFTFGRGAWASLAIGAVATLAVMPGRLRYITTLLALAPSSIIAVGAGAESSALTAATVSVPAASRQGHRLALIVLACTALAITAAASTATLEARLRLGRRLRIAYSAALASAALIGAAIIIEQYGSPPTLARRAYHSLTVLAPPGGRNLNARLFSLSLNGRPYLWRAALHDYQSHPITGSGPGTYGEYWVAHRTLGGLFAEDAHSLYLEILAELGPVGLVLLSAALGIPFAAALGARESRAVAVGFGPYCAFLVHAAADWDWEIPAVTTAALACAVAMLLASRYRFSPIPLGRYTSGTVVTAAVVVGLLAAGGLAANRAQSAALSALFQHNWAAAERDASDARTWAPWSYQPFVIRGQAELGQGHRAAATRDFRAALAKTPGEWRIWLDLADATTGKQHRAALLRAHNLNPLGVPAP
jgi:hypothetical protein